MSVNQTVEYFDIQKNWLLHHSNFRRSKFANLLHFIANIIFRTSFFIIRGHLFAISNQIVSNFTQRCKNLRIKNLSVYLPLFFEAIA